jgi:hypothetical protein
MGSISGGSSFYSAGASMAGYSGEMHISSGSSDDKSSGTLFIIYIKCWSLRCVRAADDISRSFDICNFWKYFVNLWCQVQGQKKMLADILPYIPRSQPVPCGLIYRLMFRWPEVVLVL